MNRREALSLLGLGVVTVGPLAMGLATIELRPHDGLPDELRAETYREWFTPNEDVRVTLNGAELKHCTAANRAEGWAEVFDSQEDGHMRRVRRHGRVAFERIRVPNLPEPQGGQPWPG